MTKEQFLSAIGDIDDKFIKEITDAPAILDKPQENFSADEKPQVVYLTNEHIPFWKIAASAVVAVCILTAGILGGLKLREIQPAESGSDVSLSSPDISNGSESGVYSEPNSEVTDASFNFSIYGNDNAGYYQFSPGNRKESTWHAPAKVYIERGNLSSQNTAYISVYSYDSLDYPGECITNVVTADHLSAPDDPYILTYYIDRIDDLSNKTLYLCAETDDEHVTLIGEWFP